MHPRGPALKCLDNAPRNVVVVTRGCDVTMSASLPSSDNLLSRDDNKPVSHGTSDSMKISAGICWHILLERPLPLLKNRPVCNHKDIVYLWHIFYFELTATWLIFDAAFTLGRQSRTRRGFHRRGCHFSRLP